MRRGLYEPVARHRVIHLSQIHRRCSNVDGGEAWKRVVEYNGRASWWCVGVLEAGKR
jgi:hypothetical protein